MTENGSWTEEHILASDLWTVEKTLEPMTPEEEVQAWRTTANMLDNLCGMADALMLDPLILATVDALVRAREELARAEDRLTRPAGVELTPREEDRLAGLIRRADALGNALEAYESEETPYPERKVEYLEVLREEFEQAQQQFLRYRDEVGLPRPPRHNS